MNDDTFDYKSRSQKKRESTALQGLGEDLAALAPSQWALLPLSEDLREALHEWRTLTDHEAKRRQMQYIGRLMREQDNPSTLAEAIQDRGDKTQRSVQVEKQLCALRETLLAPETTARETALAQVCVDYPSLEVGRLRHLVEQALAERAKKRPPKSFRELLRVLRNAQV